MSEKPSLTYFSPKVEKRKSTIDGRGLFARESIGLGEIVVVKGGYVLTRAQRDQVHSGRTGKRQFGKTRSDGGTAGPTRPSAAGDDRARHAAQSRQYCLHVAD